MTGTASSLSVLLATAEAAPIARVGGLAEAAAGLIRALRARPDIDLTVVMPDYGDVELDSGSARALEVADWVGTTTVRSGIVPELGEVHLVAVPDLARPHPYVDETGDGWPDNDRRFFRFSAAVAALAAEIDPDVVHLNDWHTGLAAAWIEQPLAYTIHTLGYQGIGDGSWLEVVPSVVRDRFEWFTSINPAAGAINSADAVIAVSPNYADEILDPARGAGLHDVLAARRRVLVGIRNGIDSELWDPTTDSGIVANYSAIDLSGKERCSLALLKRVGWEPSGFPTIGMVSRLVEQKGIDIALSVVPFLERMQARLVLLGSGDRRLTVWGRELAEAHPEHFAFVDGYDVGFAHEIFAGADLFLMPSRFEPCGLAQMQAMAYGTIPIVSAVGGLVDTVFDDDDRLARAPGNGFVAHSIDAVGVVDAVHRAIRAWTSKRRRTTLQKRGMKTDWSWERPAAEHVEVYRHLIATSRSGS
ncbi:MAG: glycogen synthase [Acidimicrobiales bacterium]